MLNYEFLSSVESRFRRGTGSLLESPKQYTETKVYKWSAVTRSSSDSRFSSWCLFQLCFFGSSALSAVCSLLVGKGASLFMLLVGNFSSQ